MRTPVLNLEKEWLIFSKGEGIIPAFANIGRWG
jgi:hypothetical protein